MTRSGEQTVSWYRGPLAPGPVTRLFSQVPYANADQAVIYDKATGLFDQSYAVAWQIGRFLALADAAFSAALTNWRHQGQQLLAMLDQRQTLFHSYYPTVDLPDDVKTLVNTRLPRQIARNILRRIVAPRALSSDSISRPLIPIVDPSRLRDRTEQLAGLFSPQEIDDIFMSGAEPTTELRRRLFAQPKRSRGGNK
jgi:hypothetical protein